MKFNGKEEAISLLRSLPSSQRQTILENIAQKDPELAKDLKNSLVSIDDLLFITPMQTVELIRDIDLYELGVALRVASKETRKHLRSLLTSRLEKDMLEGLEGKLLDSTKAIEIRDRVLRIIQLKVDQGKLALDSDDQLV